MKNLQPISNRTEAPRGSSLAQVKTAQLAREEEEKARLRRVRGLIVLVEQFLLDQGYIQSLQLLQQESGVSLQAFSPADNMDLLTVLTEFEQYYEFRFQRRPKLFRARGADDDEGASTARAGGEKMLTRRPKLSSSGTAAVPAESTYSGAADTGGGGGPPKHLRPVGNISRALVAAGNGGGGGGAAATTATSSSPPAPGRGESLSLMGQKLVVHAGAEDGVGGGEADGDHNGLEPFYDGRALRPLPVFPTDELGDLAQTIMRDILDVNPAVRWGDIAELESAKRLLKEAVVMPVKYPELFAGIVRPWKGILLFGPPGTGKTLLAKAVATECRTTFFNISASSIVSKWRGDSEKLVRVLFDLAVHYAPSTIFIDEVDSLMSARSTAGEHEASRRTKAELLSQMDGLSKRRGGEVVFVMAASNTPWDLDAAMLRRLEKRVLVTLPTARARECMFRRLLQNHVHGGDGGAAGMDWAACAALTEGMSGADIDIVCREAMMRPIRMLIEKLEAPGAGKRGDQPLEGAKLTRPRVSFEDVQASVACTHSSVSQEDLRRYDVWAAKFGSGLSG